jgi:hypothetical protein
MPFESCRTVAASGYPDHSSVTSVACLSLLKRIPAKVTVLKVSVLRPCRHYFLKVLTSGGHPVLDRRTGNILSTPAG